MRAEVVGLLFPMAERVTRPGSRWLAPGCGPLCDLGVRPFSQRPRGRLSCPAGLLAAEMLTVSELQCQASLCS